MRKSRFTESQIVNAIKSHENGRDAKEICRELGITAASHTTTLISINYSEYTESY